MTAPGPISPSATPTLGGLYTEQFQPVGAPKGAVVVTHGYAEHCGRYRELAHVLVNAGWAALTYDVRGHGKSEGARGYVDRFSVYLDDLDRMAEAARALAPGAPFVVLGHSHGSLITLRALVDDRVACKAAIVSSPYLGLRLPVPGYKKVLGRIASRVAPKLAQKSGIRSEDLTSDPAKQQEHREDKLVFDIATARWFTESSEAQDYVAANAHKIRVPTTWLVGGADPLVDPARSKEIAARVPGATYHDYRALKHEVFNETTRSEVFAEVVRALAKA